MSIAQGIIQAIRQGIKQGTNSLFGSGGIAPVDLRSIDLDGSADYFTIPDSAAVQPSSAVGTSLYIYWDALPTSFQTDMLTHKWVSAQASYLVYVINFAGEYRLYFSCTDTGSTSGPSCYVVITPSISTWYQFTVSSAPDGGTPASFTSFWQDAVSLGAPTAGVAGTASSFYDGTSPIGWNGGHGINGKIAELRLYNRELGQAEVTAGFGTNIDESTSGLVTYIHATPAGILDVSDVGSTVTEAGTPTLDTEVPF